MIGCGKKVKPPQKQRGKLVRKLRSAIEDWADEADKNKKTDMELSGIVQACARLEQMCIDEDDTEAAQEKQNQVAALLAAAESVLAVEEQRSFMAERNRAAIDASLQLFGNKGVLKVPTGSAPVLGKDGKPVAKAATQGWQPRWAGDCGDPFEPYQQLIEQYLHSTISYHVRALEQLSGAFQTIQHAGKAARDGAYLRTLAAAAGVTVKEYRHLLGMFNKIDVDLKGTISKKELMAAMKRDKDIAAFMQLSRTKSRDGRRETFEQVFSRIDSEGLGEVTWESFLKFFSTGVTIAAE